nr:hypothetical protein [Tanacetum cinerariifolium]
QNHNFKAKKRSMASKEETIKVPVFDGHYEHWKEMMENFLRAKQLWKLINPGITELVAGIAVSEAQKKRLEELKMADLQVKHYLYQAIDRVTFEQILDRSTSKAIWDSMKKRYARNERVKRSMLQKLRRDFEVLEMKNDETIPNYFGRVLSISNQMRSNGEEMTDTKIKMTVEGLQSTLIVHEQKFKKTEKEDEHAFKVDEHEGSSGNRGRGRGRSGFRGRGRGRSRPSFNKETVECYRCHKLGHFSYECPSEKETNYAGFNENEEVMLVAEVQEHVLMAITNDDGKSPLWFLDSGCSNHMCGIKEKFITFDRSFFTTMKLGNNTKMNVGGKGNVKLNIDGMFFVIQDVYYVPELKNCLLSVGQLQQRSLYFLFKANVCKVFHEDKGLLFTSTNKMFPISEDTVEASGSGSIEQERCNYTKEESMGKLWHERLGHISKTSMGSILQFLSIRKHRN